MTVDTFETCPYVTLICSAVDLPDTALRWFFDDDFTSFAAYTFDPNNNAYPIHVAPRNRTYNSLLGGVNIQILNASRNEDMASFLSTMMVNVSRLQAAGVSTIKCGSTGTQSTISIGRDSSGG